MNVFSRLPFLYNQEHKGSAILSNILCVADVNIAKQLDKVLTDMALPEVFIHRAKQIALDDKPGFLGLNRAAKLDESRAQIYRFYVPTIYEQGVMRRIAEATDLRMGGRGCILAQRVNIYRGTPLVFNEAKLEELCGKTEEFPSENYALISCTIPRGSANSLAAAVLELGICVPVIFFGDGVGLRDKLGLLRITVPIEKEIIWFLVPHADAELVEKTVIPRARLDVPGHGFLYKIFVHAPVVNLRVRLNKRVHAATMEQVIAALDEVHGSSDWRRLGTRKSDPAGIGRNNPRGLFFIGEEEETELFRRTAMENGAQGATLNHLEMIRYDSASQGGTAGEQTMMVSHSRELCDIIIAAGAEEKILNAVTKVGLFDIGKTCVLKTFKVVVPANRRLTSS